MATFKIQVENFPYLNWKTISSSVSAYYCRRGGMERLNTDLFWFHITWQPSYSVNFTASPMYKYIFPGNLLEQYPAALSPSVISFDTVLLRIACNSWGVCMAHLPPGRTDVRSMVPPGCIWTRHVGTKLQVSSCRCGPERWGLQHRLRRPIVESSYKAWR